jgi:hypothetical protein
MPYPFVTTRYSIAEDKPCHHSTGHDDEKGRIMITKKNGKRRRRRRLS